MAENTVKVGKFDWSTETIPEVTTLDERDILLVPDAIVALAQKSWDEGMKRNMKRGVRHSISFRGSVDKATEFATYMRDAGEYTNPRTSVSVSQEGIVVKYRAGERRGRKPNQTDGNGGNGTE